MVFALVSTAALLQFGSLDMVLVAGGATLVITSLEGYLLTPWLMGRSVRMNAPAVLIALLFWGWVWGTWGVLLAVPITAAIKAVADRANLPVLAELLGD